MAKTKKPAAKTSEPKSEMRTSRAYWLFKTEPEEHSWDMQKARGRKGAVSGNAVVAVPSST